MDTDPSSSDTCLCCSQRTPPLYQQRYSMLSAVRDLYLVSAQVFSLSSCWICSWVSVLKESSGVTRSSRIAAPSTLRRRRERNNENISLNGKWPLGISSRDEDIVATVLLFTQQKASNIISVDINMNFSLVLRRTRKNFLCVELVQALSIKTNRSDNL